MSSILFLASPRPFDLPVEIESYNNRTIFEEPWCGFDISETDKYWVEIIKPIITLPYVYEVTGLGNQYFFVYLEKYFAEGDILELYYQCKPGTTIQFSVPWNMMRQSRSILRIMCIKII